MTLLCKGLTHERELGQCGRDSQVKRRFVVSALARFMTHIDKV